MQKLIYLNITC